MTLTRKRLALAALICAVLILARVILAIFVDDMPGVYRWLTRWDGKIVLAPATIPQDVIMTPVDARTAVLVVCIQGDFQGYGELRIAPDRTIHLPDDMKRVQRLDWYSGESVNAKYVPGKNAAGNLIIRWKFGRGF